MTIDIGLSPAVIKNLAYLNVIQTRNLKYRILLFFSLVLTHIHGRNSGYS